MGLCLLGLLYCFFYNTSPIFVNTFPNWTQVVSAFHSWRLSVNMLLLLRNTASHFSKETSKTNDQTSKDSNEVNNVFPWQFSRKGLFNIHSLAMFSRSYEWSKLLDFLISSASTLSFHQWSNIKTWLFLTDCLIHDVLYSLLHWIHTT